MLDIMGYLDKGASQQTTGQLKLFPLDRQDQSWDECPWCIVFLAKKQTKHISKNTSCQLLAAMVEGWCFGFVLRPWGSAPWLWGLLKTSWVDHELHESDVRPCVWQIKHGMAEIGSYNRTMSKAANQLQSDFKDPVKVQTLTQLKCKTSRELYLNSMNWSGKKFLHNNMKNW